MAARKPRTIDEQIEAQMEDLYNRALGGDMRAKATWFDQINRVKKEDIFDIQVNIVPYRIEDPSLANILQNADSFVVLEALKGLTNRMITDNFDPDRLAVWESLQADIYDWLERMERPVDETY